MNKTEEKIKEVRTEANQKIDRIRKAGRWESRIEKLADEKGLRESQFCRKYKFSMSTFNRFKNLIQIPSEETVKRVEKALKSAGV